MRTVTEGWVVMFLSYVRRVDAPRLKCCTAQHFRRQHDSAAERAGGGNHGHVKGETGGIMIAQNYALHTTLRPLHTDMCFSHTRTPDTGLHVRNDKRTLASSPTWTPVTSRPGHAVGPAARRHCPVRPPPPRPARRPCSSTAAPNSNPDPSIQEPGRDDGLGTGGRAVRGRHSQAPPRNAPQKPYLRRRICARTAPGNAGLVRQPPPRGPEQQFEQRLSQIFVL